MRMYAAEPDYNPAMVRLSSTQQKSLAAAVVLVVGVALSMASGRAFIPAEVLTDQALSANHIQTPTPTSITPESEIATLGLRHAVSTELEAATVVSVVDGDTIVVNAGGKESTVRLIGINTPDVVEGSSGGGLRAEGDSFEGDASSGDLLLGGSSPTRGVFDALIRGFTITPSEEDEGRRAVAHLRSILSPGDMVYLQRDTSNADSAGRLLRYVWLAQPDSFTNHAEVEAKMVNGKMLADGYAVAHKFKPDDAYFTLFKAAQLRAFHSEFGLWSDNELWAQAI